MVRRIDDGLIDGLTAEAQARERRRLNLNLHEGPLDGVQRFLNALEPDSYVRPHRHVTPPKWELFIALRGALALLTFDDLGRVAERVEIRAGGPCQGVEVPVGTWHAIAALEPGTVIFELKAGPYSPTADKDFAPWAPAEGDPRCRGLTQWYREARVGEPFPARME